MSRQSTRRQLADALDETRKAKNAVHQVEQPLLVRIRELEAANTNLRRRLIESSREIHAMKVLALAIQDRSNAMTLCIEATLASGNRGVE